MKSFFFRFDQAGPAPSGDGSLRRGMLARPGAASAQSAERGAASAEVTLAAEAAVAAGYGLLFTAAPPRPAFPSRLALPAAERLQRLIAQGVADAESLPERWDAAEPAEAEALVADLLATRMDAWAAVEALRATQPLAGLAEALEAVEASVGHFDRTLAEHADFLATLADTRILAEWRLSLVDAHRHPYPWWLAGILEATAVEVDRSIAEMGGVHRDGSGDGAPDGGLCERIRAVIERPACVVGASGGEASPAPLAAWRSPDGRLSARLLSPAFLAGDPPRGMVVEFGAAAEAGGLERLRGCVAVLGTIGEPIEWRRGDGGAEVEATFSGDSLLDALAEGEAAALSLHVKPGGGAWSLVIPR